jgi:hypothetical protein
MKAQPGLSPVKWMVEMRVVSELANDRRSESVWVPAFAVTILSGEVSFKHFSLES